MACSRDKATDTGQPWLDMVAGDTVLLLKTQLDQAETANYLPYAPTLGQFVSAGEAAARYDNLVAWYLQYGPF
jgi:hypothetical protein